MLGGISLAGISGRSSLQYRFSNSHFSVSDSVEGAALVKQGDAILNRVLHLTFSGLQLYLK